MKPLRVAIYSRVSSDRQSHESQLAELREYCARRGWQSVSEFDDVINGATFTRKGLDALMKEIRHGRLDVVVCYKLDRLGRSLPHLAQLIEEMTKNGVHLVCMSQGIDTSNDSPTGQLQLGVLMVIAQFERALIRERVISGQKFAMSQGIHCGRPRTRGKHLPAVKELRARGLGINAIARELKLSTAVVWKLVHEIEPTAKPAKAAA